MNRRAAFYLVVVFVLGVALGGVGVYLADEWKVVDWHRHQHRGGVVNWLSQQLSLTPEQHQQLQAILEETGRQYREIRERTKAENEQVRQAARERMRAILTDEQRAKFDELLRRKDEERRQRGNGRHDRSGPEEKR